MSLFLQLLGTSQRVHPEPTSWDRLSRVKYCVRGLLTPQLTRKWFDVLRDPKLAVVTQNHPHIFSKLQRSYLDRTPGPWPRWRALKNHYQFVTSRLSQDAIDRIYGPSGLVLTQIQLPDARSIDLRLGYHDSLSKEGEMAITLHESANGNLIAALSFCIREFAQGRTRVFVGGLQSFKSAHQKELIITITRSLHGLRPKALLFFGLQQLAAAWDFQSIQAVSDSRHVYRHYRKRKHVAMSYDEFWFECSGQLGKDGNFLLPIASPPRDLTEMKAAKRQMYRRRQALFLQLSGQILDTLNRHTLPASPASLVNCPSPLSPSKLQLATGPA